MFVRAQELTSSTLHALQPHDNSGFRSEGNAVATSSLIQPRVINVQVDQLLKQAELLRNEAQLARAEHEQRLADAQGAAQRQKAAAEQREAALQVPAGC